MNYYGQIYIISNLLNKKQYVGVTTKTLEQRFNAHLNKAVNERSIVQKAIKKYGKSNFTITHLEFANNEQDLFKKEIKWISFYNTYLGNGYNQTEGGGGIVNMTKKIRNKISKSKTGKIILKLRGRKNSLETKLKISRSLNSKTVKVTSLITNSYFYLNYPTEGKEFNFNPSLICAVIKGKRKHHKNYYFEYVDNVNPDLIIESKKSMAVQRIPSDPVYTDYNLGKRPQLPI